jgi:uncharacterized protein
MSNPENRCQRAPNRLIKEQSPYLRQHAYNPVDWYPWGAEAFARARTENKPILLSVGYSACHWCHVMERESFEDESIARLMNDNFVSIKVDREERPDLDHIYMDAVQMITGRGGWPLTVFLTPEGKPFYGGTYFPPADRQGMPGFPRVLAAIAEAYRRGADEVRQNGDKLTAALSAMDRYSAPDGEVERDLPVAAANALAQAYDSVNGGLGQAPKFPNSFVFSLFMRAYDAGGGESFAEVVRNTLKKMARGGVYDQIGGGFHRYSVDERWLVPHFEKMLYDNALLARLYLDAARALDEPEFLSIARETLDYVLREMAGAEGGFYATQDADSEGGEGEFFLWTPGEVEAAVGERLAPIANRYFDVTEHGNFEGRNVLHRTIDAADAARMFHLSAAEMDDAIATIRRNLFAEREKRGKPARDDKILAAWNGMMISALAEGYRALHDPRYRDAAEKAARFVMATLWDGRSLRRSFKDGSARLNGYLEDYALVAGAMIDLYQATLDLAYLDHARAMADAILARFLDREHGGFFFTSDDHEKLLTRPKPVFDGSTPSGTSAAVIAMLRLHAYGGYERYFREAERTIKLFREPMKQQPFAFSNLLEGVDLYLRGPVEIVLVGKPGSAEFREWTERIGLLYVPNLAIWAVEPDAPALASVPEPARGKKQVDGRLTAYLCRQRSCSAPITWFQELEAELRGPKGSRAR